MKKLLPLSLILLVSACSSNFENYYLNDYSLSAENLQSLPTSEIHFNNVIYAKLLSNDEATEQFGPKIKDFSVVYFSVENISQDVAYFSFKDSSIKNTEKNISEKTANFFNIIDAPKLNLNKEEVYKNPFAELEPKTNNLAYTLNNKILSDFSLNPNTKQGGFLIFNKLKQADELSFMISSGTSIYTSRVQNIKLDQN